MNICEFLDITPSDFFDSSIKNTITDKNEIESYIRKLSSQQIQYIKALLKDLINEK